MNENKRLKFLFEKRLFKLWNWFSIIEKQLIIFSTKKSNLSIALNMIIEDYFFSSTATTSGNLC